MDIIKKLSDLKASKIKIAKESTSEVKYFIVYFFHDEDIVYIGKTSNAMKYTVERLEKYNATAYSHEELSEDEVDNYLAELVLELKPIYNKTVPKNTKYISSSVAKDRYFIYKPEFKKLCEEHEGYRYINQHYISKDVFDSIYAREPYHKDMPKIGRRINLLKDFLDNPIDIYGGYVEEYLYDEDMNSVAALRNKECDPKNNYKNFIELEKKELEVIDVIDSNTFEARILSTNIKMVFKCKNKCENKYSYLKENLNDEQILWCSAISEYEISIVKNAMLVDTTKEAQLKEIDFKMPHD